MTTTLELILQAQKHVKPVPKVVNERGQLAPDAAGILSEWHRVAPLVGLSLLPGDYAIERGGVDEKGRVVPPMLARTFIFGGGEGVHEHRTQWLLDNRESLTLSQAAALSLGLTYCLRDVLLIPCPEPVKKDYGPPKDRDTKPENEPPKTVLKPETKGGRPGHGFDSGVMRAPPPPMSEWELPEIQNNAATVAREGSVSEPTAPRPSNDAAITTGSSAAVAAPSTVRAEGEAPVSSSAEPTSQPGKEASSSRPASEAPSEPSKSGAVPVEEGAAPRAESQGPEGQGKDYPLKGQKVRVIATGFESGSLPVASKGFEGVVVEARKDGLLGISHDKGEPFYAWAQDVELVEEKPEEPKPEGFPCQYCGEVKKKKAARTMHERACKDKVSRHAPKPPEASQGSAEPQKCHRCGEPLGSLPAVQEKEGVCCRPCWTKVTDPGVVEPEEKEDAPDVVREGLSAAGQWKDESP